MVRDGRLIGYNTDTTGFGRAITDLVRDPAQSIVAVIGAGGVGKAIAFALAAAGVSEIRIFDTDAVKATHLANQIESHGRTKVADTVEDAMRGATGVVNGSPVGMLPNRGTPIPDALLHKGVWVADAVYTPLWTPLLNAAKAQMDARAETDKRYEDEFRDAAQSFRQLADQALSRMQKAHERVLTPQRGPAELSGWGPRSAACLPDACSHRWGLADGGQGLMALCMALSWRCHFTLGSGRARCMSWALA